GTAPAPNDPGTPAGPQGDGTSITPQGWFVSPAGTQTALGERPFGIALSPDGKFLAVSNDGVGTQSIMVVDRAAHKVIQEIDYTGPQGVYLGIQYSPDGSKLYASAGGTVFTRGDGAYNEGRVYDVHPKTGHLDE